MKITLYKTNGEYIFEHDCINNSARKTIEMAAYLQISLAEANFRNMHLPKLELIHADLRGADFTGANLAKSSFMACNLYMTKFNHCYLAGVNFDRSDMTGAHITSSQLTDCKFYKTQCQYAKIENSTFIGSSFYKVAFDGSHPRNCIFSPDKKQLQDEMHPLKKISIWHPGR